MVWSRFFPLITALPFLVLAFVGTGACLDDQDEVVDTCYSTTRTFLRAAATGEDHVESVLSRPWLEVPLHLYGPISTTRRATLEERFFLVFDEPMTAYLRSLDAPLHKLAVHAFPGNEVFARGEVLAACRSLLTKVNGFYQPQDHSLILYYQVENPVVHEAAHALDDLLETYGFGWGTYFSRNGGIGDLYAAHQEGRALGNPVSEYANTNELEYFAESLAAYHDQDSRLRRSDPAMWYLLHTFLDGTSPDRYNKGVFSAEHIDHTLTTLTSSNLPTAFEQPEEALLRLDELIGPAPAFEEPDPSWRYNLPD